MSSLVKQNLKTKGIVLASSTGGSRPTSEKGGLLKTLDNAAKSTFGAVSNALVLPVLNTVAKPFVETYGALNELGGGKNSQWVKEHGLSSPETMALQQNGNISQNIDRNKVDGYKGANFTDVLNVASLLPGGAFAKGAGAVAKGAEVATGASRFVPNVARAIKEVAPAAAGWGGAYGFAGAVDERKSIPDVLKDTAIGAGVGLATGVGLAGAGSAAGSLVRKGAEFLNPEIRAQKTFESNLVGLGKIKDSAANKKLKGIAENAKTKLGVDVEKEIANTDLLLNSVDTDGTVHTTGDGGPLSQIDDFLAGKEDAARKVIEREGATVPFAEVEKRLEQEINASNISGADKAKALRTARAEANALRLEGDAQGNIPLTAIHDLKVYKNKGIGAKFTDPAAQSTDKAITRGLKGLVEENTKTANIKAINLELGKYFAIRDYLEALDGKKVKGGRLGKYAAKFIGALAGATHGPIGSIAGSEIAGKLQGQFMKGTFGRSTGRSLEESALLRDALKLGDTPKDVPKPYLGRLALPAPAIIPPAPPDTSRLFSQEEARAHLGTSGVANNPIRRGLPAPAITVPNRDGSRLLNQDEARNHLSSLGVKNTNSPRVIDVRAEVIKKLRKSAKGKKK
jgi:hypothetical protein